MAAFFFSLNQRNCSFCYTRWWTLLESRNIGVLEIISNSQQPILKYCCAAVYWGEFNCQQLFSWATSREHIIKGHLYRERHWRLTLARSCCRRPLFPFPFTRLEYLRLPPASTFQSVASTMKMALVYVLVRSFSFVQNKTRTRTRTGHQRRITGLSFSLPSL